jgi:ribosomal-protein-alanine N-acetyltransferase
MKYTLRPALCEDLHFVLGWVDTPAALRLWGGHKLSWPPEVDKTWREIGAETGNTFTLVDAEGAITGFGQALAREAGWVHLGRIIVLPQLRGQGVGRVLVRALINEAVERHHPKEITLNVYRDNLPAVRLYRSLGFMVVMNDEKNESYSMELISDSF